MRSHRLLVVAISPVDEVALREEVQEHAGGEAAQVHIVAPAPHTSRLQRLTGAVDEARAEAEDVAREAAEGQNESQRQLADESIYVHAFARPASQHVEMPRDPSA